MRVIFVVIIAVKTSRIHGRRQWERREVWGRERERERDCVSLDFKILKPFLFNFFLLLFIFKNAELITKIVKFTYSK